jgi:hypothetical protein
MAAEAVDGCREHNLEGEGGQQARNTKKLRKFPQ